MVEIGQFTAKKLRFLWQIVFCRFYIDYFSVVNFTWVRSYLYLSALGVRDDIFRK